MSGKKTLISFTIVFLLIVASASVLALDMQDRMDKSENIGESTDESKSNDMGIVEEPAASETSEVLILLKSKQAERRVKNDFSASMQINSEFNTINAFTAVVDQEALESLESDPRVKAVVEPQVYETLLDYSAPQIGADGVWGFSIDSIQVTGSGETICVLDSGIDADHEAFTGKILEEYCYCRIPNGDGHLCCPDNTDEDDSAEDDYGHGTHVSSIVAGYLPTHKGIAHGADIVAIKVCNEDGYCHGYDMVAGIDWCVTNKDAYGITAITMSIGGGLFDSYCDNNQPALSAAINAAVNAGIPVVVASGNQGSTTQISSPACIESAIPVGAVDDNDNIYYNRGTLLDLLAPGRRIVAAKKGGGTMSKSGTSMSTPHASGAILLMSQFLKLQGTPALTPAEYESTLDATGVQLTDSTGLTYSRIDVYEAILSLDDVEPEIEFTEPGIADNALISEDQPAVVSIISNENLQNTWININNENIALTDSGDNWEIDLSQIPSLQPGNVYEYTVSGQDFADNTGESGTRKVILLNSDALEKIADINCDNSIDFGDINPFVSAIQGEVDYYLEYPDCNWLNADCNEDGTISLGDINPFVDILMDGEDYPFDIMLLKDQIANGDVDIPDIESAPRIAVP